MLPRNVVLSLCVALVAGVTALGAQTTGVLLLAHGGSDSWNANVHAIAADVNTSMPVEVALGMATRANIQTAVDRLEARGVSRIVAVPLFVSTHSSVITSTEYLLGLRTEMPPDLKIFAAMSHGVAADHSAHDADGTVPVRHSVPIRMTPALDSHPVVSAIVGSRAAAMSRNPGAEAVVLVAHGPVADDVNERWMVHLRRIAALVAADRNYASVDALTVRDDAPAPIRDAATRALRTLVERRSAEHKRVLIVPVLLSYGGIEAGIRKRLDGLNYDMSSQALAPDSRLVDWVKAMAQ